MKKPASAGVLGTGLILDSGIKRAFSITAGIFLGNHFGKNQAEKTGKMPDEKSFKK
jgi:hypothetical protein